MKKRNINAPYPITTSPRRRGSNPFYIKRFLLTQECAPVPPLDRIPPSSRWYEQSEFTRTGSIKESGNALWFILIAIILLGLLTSMLTRSGSSTNDTGDYEQLTIQANEILQYAKSIENGVQSLLARGCSENEISFEANNNSGYVNPNAPADKSCHVFEPEGAGLTYIEPNDKWLDTAQSAQDIYGEIYFPSSSCIKNVGSIAPACNGNGLPDEELLFIIPYLKQDLCLVINKINGFNAIPQDAVSMWSATEPKFTGQLIEGAAIASLDSTYWGATTLCIEGDTNPAAGTYHFYHVLLAR